MQYQEYTVKEFEKKIEGVNCVYVNKSSLALMRKAWHNMNIYNS